MVVVPAGSFTMGLSQSEPKRDPFESSQHRVTIARPFTVGRFVVTFDDWDACVADRGCNGYKPNDEGWGRGVPQCISDRHSGDASRVPERAWEITGEHKLTAPA
jgi:formylglycine-generating enzyme required for sulfatase activity